jgi:hypothetical protein
MEGILTECRAAMQLLPEVTVGHDRREGNSVAHELAKRALKYQECVVMRQNVPECVHRQVDIEVVVAVVSTRSCNDPISD